LEIQCELLEERRMIKRFMFSATAVLVGLLEFHDASAAVYTADCGTNGSSSIVQIQLDIIASSANNLLKVSGTCVGDLDITRADRLTVTGLTLTGNLSLDASVLVSIPSLKLTGQLELYNTRETSLSNVVVNGGVDVRGSQVYFQKLTMVPWTDASGTHDPSFMCSSQSECTVGSLNLTGSGTALGTGNAGLYAVSASRLTVNGGLITGFDIGVQVWNNATAFLMPNCATLTIQSNLSTGVFVADGGIVKIEGQSVADSTSSGCSGPFDVSIAGNGRYGVLADGGGNAYLNLTAIQRHSLDGIRVQHGSTVRVRSSYIDAATVSGRSARVMSQAHLYFDEQSNGPTASSILAGPVCVMSNSTVDTDNSSTVVLTPANACNTP
jgi:hypothetical protein